MRRIVVLENRSEKELKLREYFHDAPTHRYSHEIRVGPKSRKEFPATLFINHNYASSRPSTISVLLNEAKVDQILISQDFVKYVKVIVDVDKDQNVVILGVCPKLTDFCRLRGFGFLGREYRGRLEVPIT